MAGCVANAMPAAAVDDGGVWTANCLPLLLTVMAGLVFGDLVPSVMSMAVSVALPSVVSVTLKLLVPETKTALAGMVPFGSVEVMPTRSVTVLTRFQLASTALTVTLKAVQAVCALGAPLLPVPFPGAAVSPGANNCNFAKGPAPTVIEELVLAVLAGSVTSPAVTVRAPAVFKVTLNV